MGGGGSICGGDWCMSWCCVLFCVIVTCGGSGLLVFIVECVVVVVMVDNG